MRKLPLDQIEELVEESVFHPSPCKRHRERVLKNAVQATFRHKISRRAIAAGSATILVLGMMIFIVRMATSSPSVEQVPPSAEPTIASPAETSAAAPEKQPAPAGSLGEGLYRSNQGL